MEDVPRPLKQAMNIERIMGVAPSTKFSRNFIKMIENTLGNPRKAIRHSWKAQFALGVQSLFHAELETDMRCKFRSARSKIRQGMYSGLLYTCRSIVNELEKKSVPMTPSMGSEMEEV